MAKRCLVDTCKREAETYCYHCSKNVCTKHYLEHKKWIQEQLHSLVDEMNSIYDHLKHAEKNPSTSLSERFLDAHNQVERWRTDCHDRIDNVYHRVRSQIENIVKTYQNEETQKMTHNLESLEKIRYQMEELLKEGDATYRQFETIKRQLEELKKKQQESIKCSDIRILTQKFDIDKLISVATGAKNSIEKQQQSKTPQNTSSMKSTKQTLPSQHRFVGWSTTGQLNDKCPICFFSFPVSMSMTDRTVHINDHLPD